MSSLSIYPDILGVRLGRKGGTGAASPTGARINIGAAAPPWIDFRDFGGSDKTSDNSPWLQAAVDAAGFRNLRSGRNIYIPAGNYHFKKRVSLKAAGITFIGAHLDFWDVQNGTILTYDGNGIGRTVTDVATVNGNAQISSPAQAQFSQSDVGHTVFLTGTNIGGSGINFISQPIVSVQDATHATLMNAPQASLSGVTATVEDELFLIGADDGNAWDSAEYSGFSNTEFHDLAINTTGNTAGARGQANLYAAGAYAVRDWRGGSIIMNRVWISHFQNGFWGVNSDINKFSYLQLNFCKVGAYFGPRSDQNEHGTILVTDCDTSVWIDGCAAFKCDNFISVDSGSPTTFDLDIGCRAPFTSVGTRAITFDNAWFEKGGVSTSNTLAFVRIDAQTFNPVIGVKFNHLFWTAGTYPTIPSSQYFGQIGNATHIHFADNTGNPYFQHFLNFTATNFPQVVLFSGTKSNAGGSTPIPQTDYVQQAGSNPAVSIFLADENGLEVLSALTFNLTSPNILSQSADGACQSLTFTTYGQPGNATGAVQNNKNLSQYIANGYDGTAVGQAGRIFAFAKENWSTGHHGAGWIITGNINGATTETVLAIFNYDGAGGIQFLPGNQLIGANGAISCNQSLLVNGNTTTQVNPNVQINDTHGNAVIQLVTNSGGYFYGSGLLIDTTTNDDIYFRTNNTNRLHLMRGGEVIWQQNTSAIVLASSGTITTTGVDRIIRLAPTGNVTGAIMSVGFATGDTAAAQEVVLRNESAFTITFGVNSGGTPSHVIGGTSKVIPAFSSVVMTFDGTNWN